MLLSLFILSSIKFHFVSQNCHINFFNKYNHKCRKNPRKKKKRNTKNKFLLQNLSPTEKVINKTSRL